MGTYSNFLTIRFFIQSSWKTGNYSEENYVSIRSQQKYYIGFLCNIFRRKSFILIEVNFSRLLHCPRFLWCFVNIMHILKISTYHKLTYLFCYKLKKNKYTTVSGYEWAFCHAKTDISWFLCKKLEIFRRRLIRKVKRKLELFYTNLKYSTIPSV